MPVPRLALSTPHGASHGSQQGAVAVIGLSGRFPMAADPQELWRNLLAGRDCISEIPPERWDWRQWYGDPETERDKTNVKWGGFIDGVELFDPLFFGISGTEAEAMDPQQRLLLMHAWQAMEDAGYGSRELAGSDTGVFFGVTVCGYADLLRRAGHHIEGYTAMGFFPSVVPNRVSYSLDLHGPSEAIDTACSSSLIALHRAVRAIRAGSCGMAFAGGVNVMLTPDLHISAAKSGMLSPGGRSRPFAKGADGYARGEGAVVLLLKDLERAEADGDPIHGIIRGSAENHGGRANSLTSPNPKAQAELIQSAVRGAGVDPRHIGYIEAHGTGTELGDPIEVEGLCQAFRALGADTEGSCGLGSVKSNIGHLELAAGLAGVVKVLLQLRHRTLVSTLHCETLNPYLKLQGTPFQVVREARPWPAPLAADGTPLPRLAGVSSFGAGGSNAHVILQEYLPDEAAAEQPRVGQIRRLVVLSAKTAQALRGRARSLLQAIEEGVVDDATLEAAAYTLQIGRNAYTERLGLTAVDCQELATKLRAYLDGGEVAAVYAGRAQDPAPGGDTGTLIDAGDGESLLRLWVLGAEVDWRRLYGGRPPRRMALPGYPFAGLRCWPQAADRPSPVPARAGWLHPLLQRWTKDQGELSCYSRFDGNEFFFADHRVQGRRVLPGVAHLEMARAAAELLLAHSHDGGGLMLRDVTWMRPLTVTGVPLSVRVRLSTEADGTTAFTIATEAGGAGVVCSQGSIQSLPGQPPQRLDLDGLRARISQRELDPEQCYRVFAALGLDYGPAHRGLQQLSTAPEEVLARVQVPDAVAADWQRFGLHPSLLDCALQASVGLEPDLQTYAESAATALPYALDALEISGPCSQTMWAWIRAAGGESDGSRRLDVDLMDETGLVRIRLRGFSSRRMKAAPAADPAGLLLAPVWRRQPPSAAAPWPAAGSRVAVTAGDLRAVAALRRHCPALTVITAGAEAETIAEQVRAAGTLDHLFWIAPASDGGDEGVIRAQETGVIACFNTIKALLAEGYGERELGWTSLTLNALADGASPPAACGHASIHGLVGSLAKEYPGWRVRSLDLDDYGEQAIAAALRLPADVGGEPRLLRAGEWLRPRLLPLAATVPDGPLPLRQGGVYVILGGAGGIGRAFSEYLLLGCQARVYWLGRRALDDDIRAAIDRLAALGPAPHYVQADAADGESLRRAADTIRRAEGRVDGLVHSAIVLRDRALANMEVDDLRAVLAAKVDASLGLCQAFGEAVDFLLFFSSLMSFATSAGQSNYAAGSLLEDSYAHWLAARLPGRVKLINWGYWGEVGVVASAEQRARRARQGIGSIDAGAAMDALRLLLAGPLPQLGYIHARADVELPGVDRDESLALLPETLPAPTALAQLRPAAAAPEVSAAGPLNERFDDLIARLLVTLLAHPGNRGDGRYRRWFDQTAQALAARGLALPASAGTPDWALWREQTAQWRDHPHLAGRIALAEAALPALPAILDGRLPATDALFPDGSLHLVQSVYGGNPVGDYFNAMLADALQTLVQVYLRREPGARLRILEIGAGSGGTTDVVLRRLAPYADAIERYTYSDLSQAFLHHARERLGAHARFLDCRLFDVERPPAAQGIPCGDYDVVIAANVLHATTDIRRSLQHAKATLKRNGVLLLNEVSNPSLFAHITFGLLEGWWRSDDPELRIAGSPALSNESWLRVLRGEGLSARSLSSRADHVLGQQVLAAVSDGLIRRQGLPAFAADAQPTNAPASAQAAGEKSLQGRMVEYLRGKISAALKLPAEAIEAHGPLEEYGLDSILVVQVTHAIRRDLPFVKSTLFFEHSTIDSLARYCLTEHPEICAALLGEDGTEETPTAMPPAAQVRAPAVAVAADRPAVEEIAVVGLAGRYPLAGDLDAFWRNLEAGRSCIRELPGDRWPEAAWRQGARGEKGAIYTRWGGFMDGVDRFDPLFFQISPTEARRMDPQERLFLQTAYACIEDAGYTPASLSPERRVGVYAGVMNGNYPTGASYASIANRVSYLFDFKGPSLAVDSACSSSLTAIHLAISAIREGLADCALAGGVNLIVDPVHYRRLTEMEMLSSDACNRTFGADADGFVDAEGVGVALLKPLSRAVADNDNIYGVIKASVLNAGGKTNGYTVPSPEAQGRLVAEALQRAGVSAGAVSYVEAHGTGTALGDPIEIEGLTRAFRRHSGAKGYCAIGSVKSNIGHCEGAAGIAGLSKILLQLRHGMLVPTLHAEPGNPLIDFADTPFLPQRELAPWQRRLDEGVERELPRLAGLSSFGAGGANAHLLVAEYVPEARLNRPASGPARVILPLSARDRERLRLRVRQLREAMAAGKIHDRNLVDAAYTLQLGREAMEWRLGLVAVSVAEAAAKLDAYLAGTGGEAIEGQADGSRDRRAELAEDPTLQAALDGWAAAGAYGKLLDLWVKGVDFDWRRLYGEPAPRRISLPTYPFAEESYWVAADDPRIPDHRAGIATVPAKSNQVVEFNGDEAFFRDHRVAGQAMLPGVVYLELARAALGQGGISLINMAWEAPLVAGAGPLRLRVSVSDEVAGERRCEIAGEHVHFSGAARPLPAAPPAVDLAGWRRELAAEALPVRDCYTRFEALGVSFGPAHRVLQEVYRQGDRVLARLRRPAAAATLETYFLHPSLADGALQAAGLLSDAGEGLALPFALQRLDLHAPCGEQMWALARRRGSVTDIDLLDDEGRLCARFSGLSARAVARHRGPDQPRPLPEQAADYLRGLLAEVIGLPAERIDVEAPMEKYGIDSVMVMRLTRTLEQHFGSLSKSLLFEYRSLASLAGYFMQHHPQQLAALLGTVSPARPAQADLPQEAEVSRGAAQDAAPIAIIGVAGRYPEADDLDGFWRNLAAGRDSVGEIPAERWDHGRYYDPDARVAGKTYSKWGGFISGVDRFDAEFFNITPREAEQMDPQERLFLGCAHQALEDAGYNRQRLLEQGRAWGQAPDLGAPVGVFVGVMYQEYPLWGADPAQGMAVPGNPASIANRVSYSYDLAGPSIAVDSMCSSSLTSIHLACESLRRGECALALAGGVNLSLHPNKYLIIGQYRFASSRGRCESFGKTGDGYVPGEGVGAVLLKPLSRALADRDRIHGVIKGSAINHGGKTNGYSVPNPAAQAAVILRAYQSAGVDPDEVGYVEAHGTGTALGDPIEIASLAKVFGARVEGAGRCAIGSVKSNIGHCESAAGIAGLTKVLLQMRHGQLVPSLHATELNPHIDFASSPFVVQQRLEPWPRPRVAGISGFGAGGANAHLILAEGPERPQGHAVVEGPQAILVSARGPEALRQRVEALLSALEALPADAAGLIALAYTLQVGREAMGWRLGFMATDLATVQRGLRDYLQGNHPSLLLGHAGSIQGRRLGATAGADIGAILAAWVDGAEVDWRPLYGANPPIMLGLPGYPFQEQRYWLPAETVPAAAATAQLHPLVHENRSTLADVRFRTRFSGREPFLTDHRLGERCILPGTAYLEMARAGAQLANGDGDWSRMMLSEVVWQRPLAVTQAGATVELSLYPEAVGSLYFEMTAEAHSCCSGRVEPLSAPQPPPLDVDALKARFGSEPVPGAVCYQALAAMGVHYGPAHRGLQQLYIGEGEVLARIQRPAAGDAAAYVLQPMQLDAALQALLGLIFDPRRQAPPTQISVPFALERCEQYAALTEEAWVWARESGEGRQLTVCDPRGRVLVRMLGLVSRDIELAPAAAASQGAETLYYAPVWEERVEPAAPRSVGFQDRLVILYGMNGLAAAIDPRALGARVLSLLDHAHGAAALYGACARSLLRETGTLLREGGHGDILLQVVVPASGELQLLAGLAAMLRSARLENPRFHGQLLLMEPQTPAATAIARLQQEAESSDGTEVRYQGGRCLLRRLRPLDLSVPASGPWRRGGVYLITGGLGGLGSLLARDIQRVAADARVVLSGRRRGDDPAVLAQLQRLNSGLDYRPLDVADQAAVDALVADIIASHGRLDGVIHCAGVLRDGFLLRKTPEDLSAVLAPKVAGADCLQRATADLDLDFFVLCSSGTGVLGNIGQADYAAANAYLDGLARLLAEGAREQGRRCRYLSIAWPLWRDGGMGLDPETEAAMAERAGVVALDQTAGLQALYRCLAAEEPVIMPLHGDRAKLTRLLDGLLAADEDPYLALVQRIVAGELGERELEGMLSTIQGEPGHA